MLLDELQQQKGCQPTKICPFNFQLLLGKRLLRMVGLSCSKTRSKRATMVLSTIMVPFWHERVTPPMQLSGRAWESTVILAPFDAPVSFLMRSEYCFDASPFTESTRPLSAAKHFT